MRVVIALGGNALLERGEKPDAGIQQEHVVSAVGALAPLACSHQLVIIHGNGPQVGVLALESARDPDLSGRYPFDALGAQTKGVIGYWLVQAPIQVVETEMIAQLADSGMMVVCAGGGVPVVRDESGVLRGVEAVVDEDLTASLLGRVLVADALVILAGVDAVQDGYGTPQARPIGQMTPRELRACLFPAGSMRPKVEAACRFVEETGGMAAIGRLDDAEALLERKAGTIITDDPGRR
jgi:carbamate kinase